MPDRPTLPALLTNQNTGFRIFALAKSQPFIRFELRHPGKKRMEEDKIEKNNEQGRKDEKGIGIYRPLKDMYNLLIQWILDRTICSEARKTNKTWT